MALNILEQTQILRGVVKPEEITFSELTAGVARRHALYFRNTVKTVDEDDRLAVSALIKKRNACARIVQCEREVLQNIAVVLVAVVANTANMTDIENYEFADWENMCENAISDTIDIVAGISIAESQAYAAV
ncbi:MAG TPA: hypothetical protein VL022_04915 [Moheibacter sp.]|nr:hypothetical protein [Moheibacter sp.]